MKFLNDSYPCFLRVGDDWSYPFNWEAFRDLSGPIQWPAEAPLIVVISGRDPLSEPITETFREPYYHVRIQISKQTPLVRILNTWIGVLEGFIPALETTKPWFLENLKLKPEDVSPKVRQFLAYETTIPAIAVSQSILNISKPYGSTAITAFRIAEDLKTIHGEYGSRQLGQCDFKPPKGAEAHEWAHWRDSVAQIYDRDAIAKSHHQVLDGRLLLVGLALLDKPLRQTLENNRVWAPLLLEIDEAVVQPTGGLSEVLNALQLAHGYRSDQLDGEDQLGIQGEVNALCEVIMDKDVVPPIAIGLFGIWGSGKSFFMEQMRLRIQELTDKASKSNGRPKNVIQIRFNAWHYSDSSLWASLAVEIFERLVDPEPIAKKDYEQWIKKSGDPHKKKRENLLSQLETFKEAKATLEVEQNHLKSERTKLEEKREQAQINKEEALKKTSLINVTRELAKNKEVIDALTKIEDKLGFKPAIDQLANLSRELRTTSGQLTAIWQKVDQPGWTIGLILAFIIFLLLAFAIPFMTDADGKWLFSVFPALGSIVSGVVATKKWLLPAAKTVNEGLEQINLAIDKTLEVKEGLCIKRSKQEKALDLALEKYDAEITETTNGINQLNDKITSIQAQAESLTVGRQLYNFLADRAEGYQKHQGIVGMLHRDFRLLDAQLRSQDADTVNPEFPRIDRVVLYVDDLDRCSPEKVLEVLQAVHLMLALPLFTVIVGVDPRWLERSLRHQYKKLSLFKDIRMDPYLHAMPTEYLEKIFQIPLTLPTMDQQAFGNLIASLAPSTTVQAVENPVDGATTSFRKSIVSDSTGEVRTPTRSLLKVQIGSAAHGAGGSSIDLTSDEVQFAQKLSGLVDTPRAAKRFMNTYRIIRATQHVGSRSRFLGVDGKPGEYQAVLTLLAVAAGYPVLADRFLVALEDARNASILGWADFLDALKPPLGSLVPKDLKDKAGTSDLVIAAIMDDWKNLSNGLNLALTTNQLDDLDTYQKWGVTVARFSFKL